jgi:hypothetical protein
VRLLRRSARAGLLFGELEGRISADRLSHVTRTFRHRNDQLFFGGPLTIPHSISASGRIGDPVAPRSFNGMPTKQNSR